MKLYVVKKDGTREIFNVEKIINAVNKSAARFCTNSRRMRFDLSVTSRRSVQSPWEKKISISRICIILWRELWIM